MQEPIGHIVISFIRAQEEADRCREKYRSMACLPGFEAEAAIHLKRAQCLQKKALRLLQKYQLIKQREHSRDSSATNLLLSHRI